MEYRGHSHKELDVSNHTSFEDIPPWEPPVLLQVPYKPRLPEQQTSSQPLLSPPQRTNTSRQKRSASSPPHTKSTFQAQGYPQPYDEPDFDPFSSSTPSPRSTAAEQPTLASYEQFHAIPPRVQGLRLNTKVAQGTTRSSSVPSPTTRRKTSTSGKQGKSAKGKQAGSLPWRRRLKNAMKDLFKKDPIDDSQLERIEDRHWSE